MSLGVSVPLNQTPLEYLYSVMRDAGLDVKTRMAAAIALLPYEHEKARTKPLGKKEQQHEAAKNVNTGKFAACIPPRLIVSNT
jgi:hypothetical protein